MLVCESLHLSEYESVERHALRYKVKERKKKQKNTELHFICHLLRKSQKKVTGEADLHTTQCPLNKTELEYFQCITKADITIEDRTHRNSLEGFLFNISFFSSLDQ